MADLITLSSQIGHTPTNHSALRDVGYQPMLDYTKIQDKNANGSDDTFDGYRFYTDWNGSSNPMYAPSGNLFSENLNEGLRFHTRDTIGKDRNMYFQIWDRFNSNLWLPNVVGFTGFWRHNDRQTHPRLRMVCLHYMDKDGNRAGDYRPTENLFAYNSSSHYWRYDESGQHDSDVDWMIGYQLPSNRRQTVYNSQMYLHGISMQILFRTSAIARHADGRFYNFKPIIAKDSSGATKSNASTCKSGKRLVIPARGNTYPVTGNIKLT